MFHGAFYLTNAVGKRWIENGRRGAVISIVSTWVWTGSPFVTAASMSQAGIAAMTQGLAVEWGPKGVRLNAIAPGAFASEDGRGDRAAGNVMATDAIPMGRSGDHRELANLAVFLLSDECAYLTGEVIAIDGGQWLNGAGTFTRYGNLSDEDWKQIRNQSWKGTTQKK
jgi:NAD(P)-dependent dehydrogenase (short-subunit alcohol dehydrogenase family)